jgi:hypothetical protein
MKKSGKHSQTRSRRSRRRIAAATGTTTEARPEGTAENHDFAMRMKGKLPEAITSEHLELLNSGLRFLFADLRTAGEVYAGNQHQGELIALGALMRFIWLFETTLSERLDLPIGALRGALFSLEKNIVEPSVRPVAKVGRSGSSMVRQALKGHVAAAVQRLIQAGFSGPDAHERIARELKKRGVKPERGSGDVTATTVRHWCDDVGKDRGRSGPAAVAYDMTFTEDEIKQFAALPTDRARRDRALSRLVAFVDAYFPGAKTQ